MGKVLKGRGGSERSAKQPKAKVHGSVLEQANRIMPVSLRVPLQFLRRIDRVIQAREEQKHVPLPRHSWIMEAMAEKLERERLNFSEQ